MQSEAQLLEEISRLKNAISRQTHPIVRSKPIVPLRMTSQRSNHLPSTAYLTRPSQGSPVVAREVVIDGITFQSSGKSLIRKSAPLPSTGTSSDLGPGLPNISNSAPTSESLASTSTLSHTIEKNMVRTKKGTLIAANRIRRHLHSPGARIATAHTRTPYRGSAKRGRGRSNRVLSNVHNKRNGKRHLGQVQKPCRNFTTRGICNNGLNCRYKHNPDQVAICPRFLSNDCPNPEDACPLSHDPTPERVPVCVHFANGGRCRNGNSCKYPHVRLGLKEGVCRDFAVLGFCASGLDCAQKHVRECPDFAASGACPTKGCKLPHVIRAKHKKTDDYAVSGVSTPPASVPVPDNTAAVHTEEFISLTFDESSEDEEESDREESAADDSEDNNMEVSS